MSRIHVAIATKDIPKAVSFYQTLFGVEPSKLREDYAKFEVVDPPVNFTLNRTAEDANVGHRGAQHLGIQVEATETVIAARSRLESAGLKTMTEEKVTCCYAVQDKVWAVDPDGHRWEIFVTHEDTEVHSIGKVGPPKAESKPETAEEPCCAPECCT